MITRENYEIWMLDYAEGRLTPAQQKLFLDFLEQHPDLKKELEAFEPLVFTDTGKEPVPRLDLKKKQSWLLEKYSVDELVFHYTEGNLTAEEQREWNELVKTRPELMQQAVRQSKLRLRAGGETFTEKNLLKRQEKTYTLTGQNYQGYFIQYHESREPGLYDAIRAFLAEQPHLEQEFEQYGKLYLQPDTSIVFGRKEALKKRDKVVDLYWWRYAAVAASVALAVWLLYPAGENTVKLRAHHSGDTASQRGGKIHGNQIVGPGEVTAGNEHTDQKAGKNVLNTPNLAERKNHPEKQPLKNKKQETGNGNQNKEKENGQEEFPVPENKTPAHIAKDEPKTDTMKGLAPLPEKQGSLASQHNNSEKKGSPDHIQTVETPRELISAVINKKYYEEQTPRQQTSSAFYAMRNVVHTVSGGEADIVKKEEKNYKEFSFKIGNFGFSRKKHKGNDE